MVRIMVWKRYLKKIVGISTIVTGMIGLSYGYATLYSLQKDIVIDKVDIGDLEMKLIHEERGGFLDPLVKDKFRIEFRNKGNKSFMATLDVSNNLCNYTRLKDGKLAESIVFEYSPPPGMHR